MSSSAEMQNIVLNDAREKFFKGTIAVAVIYGTIALIMFVVAIVSPTGKSVLTDQLLPFTVTFIAGMVIVTSMLLISIYTAKKPPTIVLEYDNLKCPDYWKLVKTPQEVLDMYPSEDKPQLAYMCVNDKMGDDFDQSTAYDSSYYTGSVTVTSSEDTKKRLFELGTTMYAPAFNTTYTAPTASGNGSGKTYCGAVFPDYFNAQDRNFNNTEQNKLRCEYTRQCGIPWTSACPNPP